MIKWLVDLVFINFLFKHITYYVSGWAHMPFKENNVPIGNGGRDILLNGGSPFEEKDIPLNTTVTTRSSTHF
jgi:hypothetical protein